MQRQRSDHAAPELIRLVLVSRADRRDLRSGASGPGGWDEVTRDAQSCRPRLRNTNGDERLPARVAIEEQVLVTSYTLEYGSETSEMHIDAINKDDKVIIVDDLLATGGTAMAAATLVKQLGGNIAEIDFLIELSFLKGRERLKDYNVFSAITY